MAYQSKNIILKNADMIAEKAGAVASQTNDWQMVRAYVLNHSIPFEALSPKQQEKYNRYLYVFTELQSGRLTEGEIASALIRTKGIDMRTALRDITDTQEIFGAISPANKLFNILSEIEINKRLRARAEEAGEFKVIPAFSKIIDKLNAQLPDIDPDAGREFEGHTIEVTSDPNALGKPLPTTKEIEDLKKAIKDKTGIDVDIPEASDIDFEEEIDG